MKKLMLCAVALMLVLSVTTAFAASGSAKITVWAPATLNGAKLDPGKYVMTWSGEGEQVNVTLKGEKGEVTGTARATEGQKAKRTAILTGANGVLQQIMLEGKTTVFTFAQ